MNEETKQSKKSGVSSQQLKFKCFFFGFFTGIVVFIAFVFAADAYLQEDFDDVTIEDFGSYEEGEGEYEPSDYPVWMDKFVDPPAGVKPQNVYTFTCELVSRKPDLFTAACADFGEAVFDVEWTMWSAEEARGTGIYSVNDCDPVCAEGTRHEVPVYVWLSDTSTDGKNYYLNTLRIVPREVYQGKVDVLVSEYVRLSNYVVVEGKTLTGAEWDISRDWKSFPDLWSDLP